MVDSSLSPLTEDEVTRSQRAEAAGLYKDLAPADLFAPGANSLRMIEVRQTHPQLYRRLKLEFAQSLGEIKKPAPVV
jgi:hypothetical protein